MGGVARLSCCAVYGVEGKCVVFGLAGVAEMGEGKAA